MPYTHRSDDQAQRLRQARERAGYCSASEFARAAKVNYTSYAHHENGRRALLPETAKLYARLLNLPVSTLLYGDEPSLQTVPIVATITGMGIVEPNRNRHGKARETVLPEPSQMVATDIKGDDLYPAYRDGDVVFHRPLREDDFDPDIISGLECVVQLHDGRQLLRMVTMQPDGLATLHAYHAPPLINQRLVAAAPVEIVQRKMPRRYSNH